MHVLAVIWHLVMIPAWIDPPPEAPLKRDAAINDLMKPFDTGLTFATEDECHGYVSKSTAIGKRNLAAILKSRGLPDYFDAGHACTNN